MASAINHKLSASALSFNKYSSNSQYDLGKDFRLVETLSTRIRRTGLGLLSSFGFGGNLAEKEASHWASNDTIVVSVLGGISMREVAQIKHVLQNFGRREVNNDRFKVIVIACNIFVPEDVLSQIIV